jgi:hypothetical protein
MRPDGIDELISRYRLTALEVEQALSAIDPDQRRQSRGEGDWSPLQIIHHLADAEVIAGGRLRLILSRDKTLLVAYDEQQLQEAAAADGRSARGSIALFNAHIEATAELLDALSVDAWRRKGEHEQSGEYSIETWLRRRIEHAHLHVEQIQGARLARPEV